MLVTCILAFDSVLAFHISVTHTIASQLFDMASANATAIPAGSLIIVTGATSYLGSYSVKDFLERGYRVRGTVRDLSKAVWLTEEVFPSYTESGAFELVEVPDLSAPNAWDSAVLGSGAAAIIHFATVYTFDSDPNKVVPQTIEGVMRLLRVAAREPSVKRFVYTSSVAAIFTPQAVVPIMATTDTWNDAAVQEAWAPPPYGPERPLRVYAASKVASEKALFRFAEDEKPGFVVNSVQPFIVIGPHLHETSMRTTAGMVRTVYNGELGIIPVIPPSKLTQLRTSAAEYTGLTRPLLKCAKLMLKTLLSSMLRLPWIPMCRVHACLLGLSRSTPTPSSLFCVAGTQTASFSRMFLTRSCAWQPWSTRLALLGC